MAAYANLSGQSGIAAYEIGADRITVTFAHGGTYVYTAQSAGRENIERMIALAREGRGLCTFINRVVKDRFAFRLQ